MPKHQPILLLAAAWLWAACVTGAPTPNARYAVDKVWTTANGLPQNVVISIVLTRDGYLWFGTQNGLVRFDGIGRITGAGKIQFPVFDPGNTPGLESSTIVKLFEDSQGNLWVGTETEGVLLVSKDGKVSSLDIGRGSRQGRLKAACEDGNGAVWLYTADAQLCRYQSNRVDIWTVENGPAHESDCRWLVADDSGILWVGAEGIAGQGSMIFALGPIPPPPATGLPEARPTLAVTNLDLLLASKQGGHWRLADRRIRHSKRPEVNWEYPWPHMVPAVAACEAPDGNLIVGTYGDGVYWFDSAGNHTRVRGLSHSSVLSLCIDRDGCLWVGTSGGGLDRVKRQVFSVLEGTEGKTVQSVCHDGQGGLWIGYNGPRIDHWTNGILQEAGQFSQGSGIRFRNVLADRQQHIWAGASAIYGPRLFEWRNGQFTPAWGAQAINRDVSAIYQDRKGAIWVGTDGGLAYGASGPWKLMTTQDGLPSDLIRALVEDSQANLWVGTQRGGLARLHDGRIERIGMETNEIPSKDVNSLYVDSDGVLWAGTSAGLARFQEGRWTRYSRAQGLLTDNIGYLLDDERGFLWMGSHAGLMRVAKADLNEVAAGRATSVTCRSFGEADGLPVDECTYGSQPAACRTPDGRIWFPTIRGLVHLNPSDLGNNTNPPPVAIEAVLLDGRLQHSQALRARLPSSVTVPAGSERLEIDYTSLNLAAPERARFRYRMQGHEKNWTDARNERVAHYHKISPGNYRFEVLACNEDGVWSDHPAVLDIVVLPPFWRTYSFMGGMAVLLLGSIVGIVHYISTQKLQRQLAGLRQKEALEKERARIARDLHDELGANLTQVALLGELAEADKHSPHDVEAHARQISHTARETTHALDEIVWTVNPSNDTVEGLGNYICKYAQDYLALAGLRYRFEGPAQLPATPISPEVRHNVFLAAKEAVNNVVKHAAASAAWLRLKVEPERFVVEIEDDGRGLGSLEGKSDRSGLRNMRKRMEDIAGQFVLEPGQQGGTRVRLIVPIKPIAQQHA